MEVEIITDGSIVGGNPGGCGGWAAIIVVGQRQRVISGMIEAPCTNNVSELTAALMALRYLQRNTKIHLYSDSEYLIKPFATGRIEDWAARNFTRKSKHSKWGGVHKNEVMPNAELWSKLNDRDIFHSVTWEHVKGHTESLDRISLLQGRAHDYALSAARVAWAATEKGFAELPSLPDDLDGRKRLIEVIKEVPCPPDPPSFVQRESWAVFQHHKTGKNTISFIPMDPEDDGGRAACVKAARIANQSVMADPERKHKTIRGKPIYEAVRVSGPPETVTEVA